MTAGEALKAIQDAFHRGQYILDPHVLRRMKERQVSIHDLKYAVRKAHRAEPYVDPGRPVQGGTTCWRLESETMDGEATQVGVDLFIDHYGPHVTIVTVF
jgi:hypothetical protein